MSKMLLALDLDGTLLTSALDICPPTQQMLKEFRRRGHLVTIATGRPLQGARRFAQQLEMDIPIILNNGALVADAEGRIHQLYPVDVQAGRQLLEYCQTHDLPCSFFIGDDIYMRKPYPLAEHLHRTNDLTEPKLSTNPQEIIHQGVINYVVTLEPELVDNTCQQLQAALGSQLQAVRSGDYFIDIFSPGVSKGRALADLADQLGVEQNNVIAVGDNHNDLEMLRYAGLGVAMAGADEIVQQAADCVTADNDQQGVAILIEKLLEVDEPKELASK